MFKSIPALACLLVATAMLTACGDDAPATKINAGGVEISIPTPEGYCVLHRDEPMEGQILDVLYRSQAGVNNFLHAGFVECESLAKLKADPKYAGRTDTMLVTTPLTLQSTDVAFGDLAKGIKSTLPSIQTSNIKENVEGSLKNSTGQKTSVDIGAPTIYHEDDQNLMFRATSNYGNAEQPAVAMTELAIATVIDKRALGIIFTAQDVDDVKSWEEKTIDYAKSLHKVN